MSVQLIVRDDLVSSYLSFPSSTQRQALKACRSGSSHHSLNMPDGDFVLLESADGYTFVVPRKVACASGTLKAMLDEEAAFEEAKSKSCKIQQRGVILLKVIEYLAYKVQYQDFNTEDIVEDFSDRIDPYIALELLTAADFLDT